jgi:anionic cell wall polymer biosynthesis LytR-Cps2A-Psr (LCP) family protein
MKYKSKFSQYSISFLADVIKEVFSIEVDDYVKVNTEGFVDIVDYSAVLTLRCLTI